MPFTRAFAAQTCHRASALQSCHPRVWVQTFREQELCCVLLSVLEDLVVGRWVRSHVPAPHEVRWKLVLSRSKPAEE